MSSTRDDRAFLSAAAVIAAGGCLLAAVTPFVAGASVAFRGSISTSGIVGLVFAVQHARRLRRDGQPHLPGAAITTVFGIWFMAAPLVYDVGFLATAGVQLAGLLTAAFAGYLAVDALPGVD